MERKRRAMPQRATRAFAEIGSRPRASRRAITLPRLLSGLEGAFCLAIINTALESKGGIHKLFAPQKLYKASPLTFCAYGGV